MPNFGMAEMRPAIARSSPNSMCRVGIKKAMPLMNTLAHRVAKSPMASIDHRRRSLITPVTTLLGCHECASPESPAPTPSPS